MGSTDRFDPGEKLEAISLWMDLVANDQVYSLVSLSPSHHACVGDRRRLVFRDVPSAFASGLVFGSPRRSFRDHSGPGV